MANVGPDQAAIAGRLTIIYNGNIYTEHCSVTFEQRRFKLSAGGVVLFRVGKGWTSLNRLECSDTSTQHIRIRAAHFFARGAGVVTDFGDVAITWENAGGFKPAIIIGGIVAMLDEASDDGVAQVEVRPPVAEVRDAFRRQTGSEGRWIVEQMSQPKGLAAEPPAEANERVAARSAGPRGFFCTRSPTGRASLNLCEREQSACERVRNALSKSNLAACTPAQTAWCFANNGKLHCFETSATCEARNKQLPASADVCGEQY